MAKVNSTAIESVRRTGLNSGRIRFHGGKEYAVQAPGRVFRALRTSKSVGVTYNAEVKGNYPTRLVRG